MWWKENRFCFLFCFFYSLFIRYKSTCLSDPDFSAWFFSKLHKSHFRVKTVNLSGMQPASRIHRHRKILSKVLWSNNLKHQKTTRAIKVAHQYKVFRALRRWLFKNDMGEVNCTYRSSPQGPGSYMK